MGRFHLNCMRLITMLVATREETTLCQGAVVLLSIALVACVRTGIEFDTHCELEMSGHIACASEVSGNVLRMNDVQALGTHNSYHVAPSDDELAYLRVHSPEQARAIQYTHPTLREQLKMGARNFEIDVYRDPSGSMFSRPAVRRLLGKPDEDASKLMLTSGLKVLHGKDDDYRTTCRTLVDCLIELRAWSDENPFHVPIVVIVEAKQDYQPQHPEIRRGYVPVVPFDKGALIELEMVIERTVGADRILTPSYVRGGAESLRSAITENGWPPLEHVRGRFAFALYEASKPRDRSEQTAADVYLEMSGEGDDRMLFILARNPQSDYAAFLNLTERGSACDSIRGLTSTGYIVRRRTDLHTAEARSGDASRRNAAIRCGAQLISTDFLVRNPDYESGYSVFLPNNNSPRCRPEIDCSPTK